MINTICNLKKRECDNWGCGYFGASRGSRTHNGIDYLINKYALVLSPVSGTVTKVGFPYSNDLSYRYIQITDNAGFKHRVFYVNPSVFVGDVVEENQVIGSAQNLDKRYKGIPNHVHYEIKRNKEYFNPEEYFNG